MKNVQTKIEGNKFTLTADLDESHGRTKGDKGTVISTTEGYRNVPENPRLGFTFQMYQRDVKGA